MKILTRIQHQFFCDQTNWILWVPALFAFGIIFYFYFPNVSLFPATLLLIFSLFLTFLFKGTTPNLVIILIAIFLSGFLWTKIYAEKISYNPQIKHKFYATAIGEIDAIKSVYNSAWKRNSNQIILKDVEIFKAGSLDGDIWERKRTKSKKTKHKKTKPGKPKKITKNIQKNYLNISNFTQIDRKFLSVDYKSQEIHWEGNQYLNPPQRISLGVNTKMNDIKIGDIIQTRVILEPFGKPYFKGGYDPAFANYFKKIGARGFAASDLKILESSKQNQFSQIIKILRKNIAQRITDQMDENEGGIAAALLVGDRQNIPQNTIQAIRNSGLAHLIAISGLHFTLAAGIFFFSIRFLLSLNQYLTLNFNIKKIAAAIAIIISFFYLLISGTPIPAIRAFIIISLIFVAILLDLKPDPYRSLAFASLVILIFAPNLIFSVSFQLSFAAILALITLGSELKKYHINSSQRPFYLKFIFYFFGIILSSITATIATTPFVIYHFNNFISFGVFANLVAIPIVSFVTMPLGFVSLLLMPFGLEKIALLPMEISIGWIIEIANYITKIPNSYLPIKAISPASFGLIVFGGLWFLLWKQKWRFFGFVVIIAGIYFASKTPIPQFLIDKEKNLFAFHYHEKLIFLKPSKSKQAKIWSKKMGLNEISDLNDLSDQEKEHLQLNCTSAFCEFRFSGKSFLVLLGRNEIEDMCESISLKKYDLLINQAPKYLIPKCVNL
ncbi:MAG: ComEC/Rec2-related protein [Rickettsiales bacterium]|jgi:ComEC/Rec2-related protein